jgi:hypothetical protein
VSCVPADGGVVRDVGGGGQVVLAAPVHRPDLRLPVSLFVLDVTYSYYSNLIEHLDVEFSSIFSWLMFWSYGQSKSNLRNSKLSL